MNLRDKIITAAKSPQRLVKASLCGETVYMRSLTLAELDRYSAAIKPLDDRADSCKINAALVAVMARDEGGNTIFTADEVLQHIPAADANAFITDAVKVMNKPHDELRKNSEATPEGSSASGSPDT